MTTNAQEGCPFCEMVAGQRSFDLVRQWDNAFAIIPTDPVTLGHMLVIPNEHVEDFTVKPWTTASAMVHAAELAEQMGPVNLITSKGREATQSVFHLHFHLVPRQENDGLALPWHNGETARPE